MPTRTRYVITMKTEQLWLAVARVMVAGPGMAREEVRAGVETTARVPAGEDPEVSRMRKIIGQVKPDG
jgi:hypothetical protein